MGDIAASGGYYISAPADAIFAEPSTMSGSIGIFGYKVDVRKLMATLGIGVETNRRGAHADYQSPYRPWTDDEKKLLAEKIRYFYDLFLTTVAEGRRARGLTAARVDEIGRGHVWTGARRWGWGWSTRWAASPRPSTSRRASAACRSSVTGFRRSRCCRSKTGASCAGWRARPRCSTVRRRRGRQSDGAERRDPATPNRRAC